MSRKQRSVAIIKPLLLGLPILFLGAACEPGNDAGSSMNPIGGDSINTLPPELLPTDEIVITDAGYGGSGCPQGTVSHVISPERDQISVFFDQYHASSGEADATLLLDGTTRIRKSCNVGVALHVPQGLSVALVAMDYRGYVYVPEGGRTILSADYFFAGSRTGLRFTHKWYDPSYMIEEDFMLRDEFYAGAIVWSGCGEDVILRANTNIRAYSSPTTEHSDIQVDSLDASAKIVYRVQWRQCEVPVEEPVTPEEPVEPDTTI